MAGFDRNRPSFEPSKSRLPPEAAAPLLFRPDDDEFDDADTEMEQDEFLIGPALPPPVKPKRKPDIVPPPPPMAPPPSAPPLTVIVDQPMVDVSVLPTPIPRARTVKPNENYNSSSGGAHNSLHHLFNRHLPPLT
jgi:hypothetical protein